MILVIVYVGAVAVLFLFVVMMLDINFAELRAGFQRYCRSAPPIGVVLLRRTAAGARRLAVRAGCAVAALRADAAAAVSNTGAARAAALHRLHLPVPDRRAGAAGGDDRRDRADAARPPASRHQNIARADRAHVAETLELVDVRIGAGVRSSASAPEAVEPTRADDAATPARRIAGHHAPEGTDMLAVGLGHYLVVVGASCWCSASSASS